MKRFRTFAIIFFSVLVLQSRAQLKGFHFQSKLADFKEAGWYSLYLPDSIFPFINHEFTDLRIYRFKDKDTIESPYILRIQESKNVDEVLSLKMINKSTKNGTLYSTFELNKNQHVNYLELEFEEHNFNGYAQLEGSVDQKEWFKIDSLKRILSIQSVDVNFNSTTLIFPETNYTFLRLSIKADKPLTLKDASFKKRITKAGLYTKTNLTYNSDNNRKTKQTNININLKSPALISKICISTDHALDFYRPISIESLRDSSKTPKGWTYYYDEVFSGTITSLDDKCFEFPYLATKKLRITIHNSDNAPLTIKSIDAFGPVVELMARLEPGDNHLFYGNANIGAPSYDIVHFEDKIPTTAPSLALKTQENLLHPLPKKSPLFESKVWLWLAMGLVILVLGFFTLRMMKSK